MLCNLKLMQKSAEVSTPLHPLVPLEPPLPPVSPPLHYWGPSALTSPGGIFQHIVQLVHRGQHSVGQFKSMIIIGNGSIYSTYYIRLIYYQKWQNFQYFFTNISGTSPLQAYIAATQHYIAARQHQISPRYCQMAARQRYIPSRFQLDLSQIPLDLGQIPAIQCYIDLDIRDLPTFTRPATCARQHYIVLARFSHFSRCSVNARYRMQG